ncbi:DUF3035 domain-containing protein [Blastomonas fulva]|uniref:DUF3035 domain-containing protein n=1 Tax=Blastomonas fulva TaxID=1550728 RepID=UPI0025A36074|nr:DUF3035 domain-containing protein [Blastomonas fulva]MDM7928205.1 DUF3035 domain-containing protein [Blastomonas fulva]MDM7965131.1 DUF3035 domain-containing protein [Blastomonas fulva]
MFNPSRKLVLIAGMSAAATTLSACGSGGGIFNRDRPDEFAVSRQAPLVIPPDFSLTPPTPGAVRPQSVSASQQALDALFGGPQARTGVEGAALDRAGSPDTAIRSQVGDPKTQTTDKGTTTRDIVAAPEGDGQDAKASIPQ